MMEAVYSSQGGREIGYRCRVLVDGRLCGKLCKSYRGCLRHGWLIHGVKLQMELFENVQEKANAELESIREQRAAERSAAEPGDDALSLFAAAKDS